MRVLAARRARLVLIAPIFTIVLVTSSPSVESKSALPNDDAAIVHALNRLTFGATARDVERVKRIGLAKWIDEQLNPSRIDDSRMQARLAGFETLTLSSEVIARDYERPARQERLQARRNQVDSPSDPAMTPQGGEAGRAARPRLTEAQTKNRLVLGELSEAKLLRAVYSERQLEEVLVDFWFNHFNVYAQKGAVRWMVPAYEREAIQPHALGRFRDLVVATARHPAMLFYLDNWLSTRADLVVPPGRPNAGQRRGLNENYARELMELHTLGVDGGYTQQDVMEVARAFTGWTIDRPQQGGGFVFRPQLHDRGAKRVLGHVIPAGGGEEDGLRVIDILVRHEATARFVATKLARRFVSDDPPGALVERAAATFRATDGDIRAVLATIFAAPEFWSAESYRAKVKTPLELVASAVRAVDGRFAGPAAGGDPGRGGLALAREVGRLGEPLYEAQPPTGYPDRAEAWVNAGALLGRMNFALALAHNRLAGTRVDLAGFLDGVDRGRPAQVLDRLLAVVLHGEASARTRAVLAAQLDSPEITRTTTYDRVAKDTDVEKLAALVLGSPEFQRR
jgi:uncharacterized protein (DUF1800 family)